MGLPVWKEPPEKRDVNTVLDPRRAAVPRRSGAPGRRIRSSQTFFNHLLRNGGENSRLERREPERITSRAALADLEARVSLTQPTREGLGRIRLPLPASRSEDNRVFSGPSSSESYTPRFPPANAERLSEDESRRARPFASFAATAILESPASSRRAVEGSQRPSLSERVSRRDSYSDEYESLAFLSGGPWPGIDGLGDRELSLRSILPCLSFYDALGLIGVNRDSPPSQWELVSNDLGFQAAVCDLWESESDGDVGSTNELVLESPHNREEARIRHFISRSRDMDRLIGRL